MFEIISRWTNKRERGVWVRLEARSGYGAGPLRAGDELRAQVGVTWKVSRVDTDGSVLLRGPATSPSKDILTRI